MKKIIVGVLAVSAMIFSSIAAAQSSSTTTAATPTASTQLENYLNALYLDAIGWIIDRDYSGITEKEKIVATNTATANIPTTIATITTPTGLFGSETNTVTTNHDYSPTKAVDIIAQKHTADNVTNTLTQLPFAMNNLTSSAATTVLNQIKDADGNQFAPNSSGVGGYFATHSLQALTVGESAPGSDTLYVGDSASQGTTTYTDNISFLQQPANPTNAAFNFANLMNHTSYTPTQLSDAKRFIEYAAQSTQDITQGFNFNQLFAKPAALLALKQMPSYQNYVMQLRSLIALRSMNINTLNQLIAERTPITGLGTTAGVEKITYDSKGKETKTPIADASPLQVEAYQANHRIESKNWYAKIEAASPATVQRDTLVVLAEIEHQNYEAHLDRERLLAAISAVSLQSGMASITNFLTQASSTINSDITNALNPPTTPTTSGSSSESNAATAGTSTTSSSTTSTTSSSATSGAATTPTGNGSTSENGSSSNTTP